MASPPPFKKHKKNTVSKHWQKVHDMVQLFLIPDIADIVLAYLQRLVTGQWAEPPQKFNCPRARCWPRIMAISGNRLCLANDKTVWLMDSDSGQITSEWPLSPQYWWAFAHGDDIFLFDWDEKVTVCSLTGEVREKWLDGPDSRIKAATSLVAFTASGSSIQSWSRQRHGQLVKSRFMDDMPPFCITANEERLFVNCKGNPIQVLDVNSLALLTVVDPPVGPRQMVASDAYLYLAGETEMCAVDCQGERATLARWSVTSKMSPDDTVSVAVCEDGALFALVKDLLYKVV